MTKHWLCVCQAAAVKVAGRRLGPGANAWKGMATIPPDPVPHEKTLSLANRTTTRRQTECHPCLQSPTCWADTPPRCAMHPWLAALAPCNMPASWIPTNTRADNQPTWPVQEGAGVPQSHSRAHHQTLRPERHVVSWHATATLLVCASCQVGHAIKADTPDAPMPKRPKSFMTHPQLSRRCWRKRTRNVTVVQRRASHPDTTMPALK